MLLLIIAASPERPDDVQIRYFVQFVLNICQSDQFSGDLQFSRGSVAEPRQVILDLFVQRRFVAELRDLVRQM